MRVRFDHPQRVRPNRVLVARHLLLLKAPLRQLDLVREEVAPRERVPEPELGSDRAQALGRLRVLAVAVLNLDEPVVVHVAREALHAVPGDLVLEIDVADRRAQLVRVQVLVRRDVLELDAHVRRDVVQRLDLVVEVRVALRGGVYDEPVVVRVAVRVERDLLLLGSSRVRVVVRVEVAALGVNMTEGDRGAKGNVYVRQHE